VVLGNAADDQVTIGNDSTGLAVLIDNGHDSDATGLHELGRIKDAVVLSEAVGLPGHRLVLEVMRRHVERTTSGKREVSLHQLSSGWRTYLCKRLLVVFVGGGNNDGVVFVNGRPSTQAVYLSSSLRLRNVVWLQSSHYSPGNATARPTEHSMETTPTPVKSTQKPETLVSATTSPDSVKTKRNLFAAIA